MPITFYGTETRFAFAKNLDRTSLEDIGLVRRIEVTGKRDTVAIEVRTDSRRTFVCSFHHTDRHIRGNSDTLHHHTECDIAFFIGFHVDVRSTTVYRNTSDTVRTGGGGINANWIVARSPFMETKFVLGVT